MESTGRRERKRLARRLEILEAAAVAFRKKGFDQTRIEEIATLADVAPGTVYNHFPTKDTLLIGLARHYRSQSPKALATLLANPPKDPVKAFSRFYAIMTAESLRYLDKLLWRHVHAAMTVGGWHEHGNERWSHEEDLIAHQCSMIRSLQAAGAIDAGVDDRVLAEVIHSCGFFWWQRFIAEDEMSLPHFTARMAAALKMIFATGLAPGDSPSRPEIRRASSTR
jgi:AcrR family transcriptional regulator